jgi:LPXTG-motif cell wall-anchored protein
MKNSIIYILGATVLVGGGAYLFLKNKKKQDTDKLAELDKLGGTTETGTTGTGTGTTGTGTGTTGARETGNNTSQANSLENQNKADDIANLIFNLKTRKIAIVNSLPKLNPTQIANTFTNPKVIALNKQILTLQEELKKLGYREEMGKAIQLVPLTIYK